MTNDTFKIKMRTNVWYVYVGLLVPYTQKIWNLDEEVNQVNIHILWPYFPFFYYNNLRQQSLEDEMENRCRILLQKLHVHDGMRFTHTDRQRGCGRVHQIRDTLTAIIRSVDVKWLVRVVKVILVRGVKRKWSENAWAPHVSKISLLSCLNLS